MKFFLTGATGFVGAGLAKFLVEAGHEVHVLMRPESRAWRLEPFEKKLHIHHGDLRDANNLTTILSQIQPETVYHLATYGAYPAQKETTLIFETALIGTHNLLTACQRAGVKIVVNVGSSSEYGQKDHPIKETDLLEPTIPYGVGKAAQTLLCQQFSRQEGLPIITFRPFSVYGPGEEPGRLFPNLITRALRNQPIPLASPDTTRDFIYLDDVVQSLYAAKDHPEYGGEIFNLGTGLEHTLKEVAEMVLKETGSASPLEWQAHPGRSYDTAVWVADVKKLVSTFSYTPRYSLSDGVKFTVAWYREFLANGGKRYD